MLQCASSNGGTQSRASLADLPAAQRMASVRNTWSARTIWANSSVRLIPANAYLPRLGPLEMKKLTPRYREWLRRRSLYVRMRRGLTRVRYAEFTTLSGRRLVKISNESPIPEILCLDRNNEESLVFFHDLRLRTIRKASGRIKPPTSKKKSRIGWVRSYTDFSKVRSITPGAALILAAEYDRVRRNTGIIGAINLDKWDKNVLSTLSQLGFFELLGFPGDFSPNFEGGVDKNLIYIAPMRCGDNTDYREAADDIRKLFLEVGGDMALKRHLFGAIVDAIENVKGHAYGNSDNVRNLIPPLWWFSGSADPVKKILTLAIYDQGQTIPVTLPKKWPLEELTAMFAGAFGTQFRANTDEQDGEAVEAALRMSRSSTKLPERGKGLSKILNVVRQCPGGRMRLISRRGHYIFSDGRGRHLTCSTPLLGTFIELEANFSNDGGENG